MRLKLIIFVGMFALQGCIDEETKEPTHDVSWYSSHESERTKKLKECKNNPGELDETPNCKNAQEAQYKQTSKIDGYDLSRAFGQQ